MNRMQKIAWLCVITISIAVVSSGVAIGILYFKYGFPKAAAGLGLLGIAGIGGFSPLIFKKDKGAVTWDERDKQINRKAALAGFGASYLAIGLACMIPFTILGPDNSISVNWLPMIFASAFLASVFVRSIAILIQYRKGEKS